MANVRDYYIKCIAIDYPYFSFEKQVEILLLNFKFCLMQKIEK